MSHQLNALNRLTAIGIAGDMLLSLRTQLVSSMFIYPASCDVAAMLWRHRTVGLTEWRVHPVRRGTRISWLNCTYTYTHTHTKHRAI